MSLSVSADKVNCWNIFRANSDLIDIHPSALSPLQVSVIETDKDGLITVFGWRSGKEVPYPLAITIENLKTLLEQPRDHLMDPMMGISVDLIIQHKETSECYVVMRDKAVPKIMAAPIKRFGNFFIQIGKARVIKNSEELKQLTDRVLTRERARGS